MPRYEPIKAYERLILKVREHPFAGAQIGLDDAKVLARVLKIGFRAGADHGEVEPPRSRRPCSRPMDRATSISSSSMRRRKRSSRLADAVRGRDVLLFNVTAPDDALRRDLCAQRDRPCLPEPLHEHGRSGAVSRVAQMAGFPGAAGAASRATCWPPRRSRPRRRNSARAIVANKPFKAGTDPREREQNNPALLSAINRDYDVGVRRRRSLRFRPAGALSSGQTAARWSAASISSRGLALDLGAQRRAAGEFALPEARRPPHGRRRLGRLDGGQDGGAGGVANQVFGLQDATGFHPRQRGVFDGDKGLAMSVRPLGPSIASGDPAGDALLCRRERAG